MSDKAKTPEKPKEPSAHKDMIKMRGQGLTENRGMKQSASSGAITLGTSPEKKSSSSSKTKDFALSKKDDGDKKDGDKKDAPPSPGKSKSPRSPRKIVVSSSGGNKSPGGSTHKGASGSKSPKDSKDSTSSPHQRTTSSAAPGSPSSSHKSSDGSKSPKDGSKSPKEGDGSKSPKDGSKSPGRTKSSRGEKKDEKSSPKVAEIPPRKESKAHAKDDLGVKRTDESESSDTSGTSASTSGTKPRSMKRAATVMSVSGSDAFLHARLAVVGSRDVWFSMLAQWQGIPLDPKDNPKTFLRTLKVDGKEYLVTAYDYTEKKERRLGANSYVFVFDSDHRDSFDMLRQYMEEIANNFGAGARFPCVLWNTKRIMDIYAEDLEDALDPADGADPEKIRQLARDLGTGLMPLVSSNVQEQLDVAFNAAIRQGLAYQKFQAAKDEKEKGKEGTKDPKDSKKK